jgi:hypothetical protein
MAVGESGTAIRTTTPVQGAGPVRNASVAAHIHRGTPESTVGGPGCTVAPGASQEGADSSSPYGAPASS